MPESVSPPTSPFILRVNPKLVVCVLSAIALLLVLAHFLARVLLGSGVELGGYIYDLWPKVDLDAEANIPTWFSSFLFLFASALLGAIGWLRGAREERHALYWKFLALLFLGFSMDEAASLHEITLDPLRNGLHLHGVFYFGWVVAGIIFAAAVGLAYLRFLLSLSKDTRNGFVAAGAIFLCGALGMEMVNGAYAELHGLKTFAYSALSAVEESLEMAGLIVFIRTLLAYLAERSKDLGLRLSA